MPTTSTRAASATSRPSPSAATRRPFTPASMSRSRRACTPPIAAARRSPKPASSGSRAGVAAGLERATLDAYRGDVHLHINPMLGNVRLSQLTAPMVRAFEDRLGATRSQAMVRRVLVSLGSIVADAMERGQVAQNVVRGRKRRSADRRATAGRKLAGRRRHSHPGRNPRPHPPSARTLAPAVSGGGLYRPALIRAARTTLERCQPKTWRDPRAPARRPLQRLRSAQVSSRRTHHSAAADGGERPARAQAHLQTFRQPTSFSPPKPAT